MLGLCIDEFIDHGGGLAVKCFISFDAGVMSESDSQMGFTEAGTADENDVGAVGEEIELEEMLNMHAVDFIGMAEVIGIEGSEEWETGVVKAALGGALRALFEFTANEFVEEVDVAVSLGNGMLGDIRIVLSDVG
jgi:hypothetical protein